MTVTATSGKTGTEIQISYTNCKVVGNGSFGVVFAAKMLGWSISRGGIQIFDVAERDNDDGSHEDEQEIAIKKVLQDKRFKVSWRNHRVEQKAHW